MHADNLPKTKKNTKIYRNRRFKIVFSKKKKQQQQHRLRLFQRDMTCDDVKVLLRRTTSISASDNKVLNLAKSANIININVDLFQWFINILVNDL